MTTTDDKKRLLRDLGEFAILERMVFPTARRYDVGTDLGDDCGFVEVGGSLLAVSADAGPRPLIQQVCGYETDYESAGWHAVVATASDIATAGATPLFLVDTIDAPADLPQSHLQAFLDGYFRACADFGFKSAGGDIRQAGSLVTRVFGAGLVEHGMRIGRGGVAPGDDLVLIGPAGSFIAAFLETDRVDPAMRREQMLQILRFPRPKLREMSILAASHLVVAASDSSDGVLGAVENIGKRSGCGFELALQSQMLPTVVQHEASIGGFNPWNLFFCWGDWSVAVAVRRGELHKLEAVAARHAIEWMALGRAVEGPFALRATVDGRPAKIRAVRNENFTPNSFSAGVRRHVANMLTRPLFF